MDGHASRGDFATNARLLRIAAIAVVVGVLSTLTAYVLLHLISFFTNLFFFQSFSFASRSPASNTLGWWVLIMPVIGGLLIGLIARYGSEAIRGHGIPEAIEAILFGKSKMSPKVAVLKPLSSAIAIGSGGPFGAEGPIIMTGGAIGSLIAQFFHLTGAERKTLLVAGAVAGMTAVFGTPVAAVLLAVELLLFELRPRSLLPVALACAVAAFTRPLLLGSGALVVQEAGGDDHEPQRWRPGESGDRGRDARLVGDVEDEIASIRTRCRDDVQPGRGNVRRERASDAARGADHEGPRRAV